MKKNNKTIVHYTLILSFFFPPLQAFTEISCHLHPADNKKQPVQKNTLAKSYSNQQECNNENEQLYQLKGRCHCGFTRQTRSFNFYDSLNPNNKVNSALP